MRTGNLPIKLVLQDKIGSAISKAKDTKELIGLLEQQHVSPRFNVSETTGRVSGVSFRYQGVVYKGSTLGKKFSWNSITKQIDYEQTRDRSIVLSANEKERGTHPTDEREHGRSIGPKPRNNRGTKGVEDPAQQPKGHLDKIEGNGVVEPLVHATDWNPFKLELLDGNNRKKSKRKKKRRGLGL